MVTFLKNMAQAEIEQSQTQNNHLKQFISWGLGD
jgi:hypothetical protein